MSNSNSNTAIVTKKAPPALYVLGDEDFRDQIKFIVDYLLGHESIRVINSVRLWPVYLHCIDSEELVEKFARALRTNNRYENGFFFNFCSPLVTLNPNWDPLLEAIGRRQHMKYFEVAGLPTGNLLPLFNGLFPALQRNTSLLSLRVGNMDLSSNRAHTSIIASYLGSATSLQDLTFRECKGDAANIAEALQRNTNLQCLRLEWQCEDVFVRSIIQKLLAPREGPWQLKKLVFSRRKFSEPVREALLQCWQGTTDSPIECIEVEDCDLSAEVTSFLLEHCRGELSFSECRMDPDQSAEHVVNAFSKMNLRSLRISDCNFFEREQFTSALAKTLVRPKSPLRCLYLNLDEEKMNLTAFRTLMDAASSSSGLKSISFGPFDYRLAQHEDAIFKAIRTKVEDINLRLTIPSSFLHRQSFQRNVFQALKENYHVLNFQYGLPVNGDVEGADELTYRHQAGHDLNRNRYLDRNMQLATWDKDPDSVPRMALAKALRLAQMAGFVSLFRSLVVRLAKEALEGEAARWAQQSKANRPQANDKKGPEEHHRAGNRSNQKRSSCNAAAAAVSLPSPKKLRSASADVTTATAARQQPVVSNLSMEQQDASGATATDSVCKRHNHTRN